MSLRHEFDVACCRGVRLRNSVRRSRGRGDSGPRAGAEKQAIHGDGGEAGSEWFKLTGMSSEDAVRQFVDYRRSVTTE